MSRDRPRCPKGFRVDKGPGFSCRFGTTWVVGRQPNAPAAFTPGEIPGTHFQRLSRPQGTWFCRGYHGKNPQVTPPGIDPGTVRLVAQRLNHYATPVLSLLVIIANNLYLMVTVEVVMLVDA